MTYRTAKKQSVMLFKSSDEIFLFFFCSRNCYRQFNRSSSRCFSYCNCSYHRSNFKVSLFFRYYYFFFINLNIVHFRRRRAQSLQYLKSDDDHRQHLNASTSPSDRHPKKPIQIEHPHLLSSSSAILPSPIGTNHHRPNSSISILTNDGLSDRESLLKQAPRTTAISTNIDNFYEEIKEQQQQANLALGNNHDTNPYLEPKSFEDRKKFFEENKSSQPIRDHREVFYYECEG